MECGLVSDGEPRGLRAHLSQLGQALAAPALFLPWRRRTRGPAVAPSAPVRPECRGGPVAAGLKAGSGRWRLAGWSGLVGGLIQLLLAAPLLVAVLFDALGE